MKLRCFLLCMLPGQHGGLQGSFLTVYQLTWGLLSWAAALGMGEALCRQVSLLKLVELPATGYRCSPAVCEVHPAHYSAHANMSSALLRSTEPTSATIMAALLSLRLSLSNVVERLACWKVIKNR